MNMTYAALAAGLIVAGVFIWKRDKHGGRLTLGLKTAASVLFLLTAVFAYFDNGRIFIAVAFLVAFPAAFAFSIAGDVLLDAQITAPESKRRSLITAGMVMFTLAHIGFSTALLAGGLAQMTWWVAVFTPLTAVAMYAVARFALKCDFKGYHASALAYSAALNLTLFLSLETLIWGATFNYTDVPVFQIMLFSGVFLFWLSDAILCQTLFGGKDSKLYIAANHATYYAGQFLIAFSVLFM